MNGRHITLALVLALTVGAPGTTRSQRAEPDPDSPDAPLFGVSSALVQVDVVVRDKRGRAIRDLTAEDFVVYEDGERQTVRSFRVVTLDGLPRGRAIEIAPARTATGAAATAAPDPPETPDAAEPTLIVFVFDRLSTEARDKAHKAANRYLESGHVEGDVVAVFAIDQALHLLQDFTVEREEIARAFGQGLTRGSSDFASTRDAARDAGERSSALNEQAAAAAGDGGAEGQTQAASIGTEAAFAAMQERMALGFDRLERDQQGYATTNGLLAIVDGLKPIPGRKTVVFFSEGLALPANVLARFRSVIAEANRAQVSVYAIDAGGLRVASDQGEARRELLRYARQRERQEASGTFSGGDGPTTRRLEQVEESMRFNPHTGLGQLAEETGGFLVADTNDASAGFERIQEDMRFHYVLAYTPTDPSYDGRFREISVEVSRKDARVQSRKGYFAVPPDVVVPVRSFEAPAIAALDRAPAPTDFPLETTSLSFPQRQRPGRVTLFASLPVGAMAFRAPTGDGRTDHEAEFTVVAQIRDESGNEVDRISQHYPVSVPPESLESAKAGDALFYKVLDLAPGRYTVQTVAHDAIADSASVASTSIAVPDAASGAPLVSSLTLVRRGEQLPPEERQQDNPLIYGELLLYPNLGDEPFTKANPLTFFFTIQSAGQGVEATLELLQNGQVAVTIPVPLGAPDDDGRIQYAGTLPLESMPPGSYGLRVNVTGAGGTATREAEFRVAP